MSDIFVQIKFYIRILLIQKKFIIEKVLLLIKSPRISQYSLYLWTAPVPRFRSLFLNPPFKYVPSFESCRE